MTKDASFRSLRYTGNVLGVDLGTHTLKVIQLRVNGGRASLVARAEREVWPQLAEAKTDSERKDVYARALKDALKSGKFTDKRAALALSGNHSIVKFVKLAKGYKKDPRTGVPEEAKTLSPFDPHDTLLDARTLTEETAEDPSSELMVVVAQRNAIIQKLRIVQKARLRPAVVLNDALALENAYNFTRGKEPQDPVVLLDLGATTTSVSIIEDGALRAVRTFNIAGDAFTRAIKRELNVTMAEAEALKREYGLHGHRMANEARLPTAANEAYRIYNETSVRVYRAVKPVVKDLCGGILRTIESFNEKRPPHQFPVTKILLAGGSAELKALAVVMNAELHMPVELFEPFRRPAPAADGSEPVPPAGMAVAFGLGLAGALRSRSAKPRINLLPGEAKRAAAMRNSIQAVAAAALIACGLWLAWTRMEERRALLAEQETAAETKLKAIAVAKPKSKKGTAAAVEAAPKPPSPYAYLSRLKVSGVFGDTIILAGPSGGYTAREGRLADETGRPVPGVSTELRSKTVILRAGSESYSIPLPK